MKSKKKRQGGRLSDTFSHVKKEYFLFFSTIFFDLLFVLGISLLGLLLGNITRWGISFFVPALLGYLILGVVLYSSLKFAVMRVIKKIVEGSGFIWKGFLGFLSLNLIIMSVLLALFLILSSLLYAVVIPEQKTLMIRLLFVVFLFLGYPFLNFCHSAYMKSFSVPRSMPQGFKSLIKASKYLKMYGFSILALLAYFSAYAALAFVLDGLVFNNLLSQYSRPYNLIFFIITFFVVYIILAFNRIYLYMVSDA